MQRGKARQLRAKIEQASVALPDEDALEAVARWSDGRLADVVYECICLEATLDQAIRSEKDKQLPLLADFESPFPFNI